MTIARSPSALRCGKPALLLAVVALLLRCIIAPGFMLDLAAMAQGGLKLVICTPWGSKSIGVALGKEQAPSQSASGDICPYAASAAVGEPADPVILASESLRAAFQPWKPGGAVASLRSLAFSARAPPATV
jgi:hypothetical protein